MSGLSLALALHAADATFRLEHTCVHDAIIAKAPPPRVVPQRPEASRRRNLQELPPAGLRISFDMETLAADERACTSEGQVVDIGRLGGPPCSRTRSDDCRYTCAGRDILSSADVDRLSSLLPAVASWFGAALALREHIPRPDRLTVDTQANCGFGGAVPIPSNLGAPGLADTDVAILVTARCGRAAAATAGRPFTEMILSPRTRARKLEIKSILKRKESKRRSAGARKLWEGSMGGPVVCKPPAHCSAQAPAVCDGCAQGGLRALPPSSLRSWGPSLLFPHVIPELPSLFVYLRAPPYFSPPC
jgi:hypothetical protein